MTLSADWRALQREAQLAAEQIAMGTTTLGRANHAQTGLYAQAFFGLSIGLERVGKLIIVADHAIRTRGSFPTDTDLRKIGHDLSKIMGKCEEIALALDQTIEHISRPDSATHLAIVAELSDFATRSRYYNLNYLSGSSAGQADPIRAWWEHVAEPICDQHYSEQQRARDDAEAAIVGSHLNEFTMVRHHGEDGTEITDSAALFSRAQATKVVQRYGRLYVLQIVRWLAAVLSDLSHRGAYEMHIDPLMGLYEPFNIFRNPDKYLRERKTWSIYRP